MASGHHQTVAGLKRSLSSYESRMADMELALQRLTAEKARREADAKKVAEVWNCQFREASPSTFTPSHELSGI